MSRMMTAPIVGAVAGNVLKTMRIEIDYPDNAIYYVQTASPTRMTSIVWALFSTTTIVTSGTSSRHCSKRGQPVVEGVEIGDELIGVDGVSTTGATLDAVNRALHGRPGDKKKLRLLRKGKEIELAVAVQHLL